MKLSNIIHAESMLLGASVPHDQAERWLNYYKNKYPGQRFCIIQTNEESSLPSGITLDELEALFGKARD